MLAKSLLGQRDAAVEQFSRVDVIERRVRIGVTELTAMTWLPRWVELIQEHYPKVTLEPDVDGSVNLREKVLADELDLIVVPDAFADTRIPKKAIGKVESAWMCKPGFVRSSKAVRLHELASHDENQAVTQALWGSTTLADTANASQQLRKSPSRSVGNERT